jgi:nucleotide-binding universal stress UspA family protein
MILIGYDGSEDARAAIEATGTLLSGQAATILTVWEPFIEVLTRTSYGVGMTVETLDIDEIDASNRKGAESRAQEGAELARRAGLDAQPLARAQDGTIADAILKQGDELDASAIAVGSRGLTGLKSVLLGSVSNALLHHADRPVIVVPSAHVAAARKHRD